MLPHILPLLAQIPHTVYIEPFCGGAAVLFATPRKRVTNSDHYRECLNDSDERIVTLYRVAQEQHEALLHKLRYTPYSQAEHARAKDVLRDPDAPELDRAWAVVVQTRQSFATMIGGGWQTAKISKNSAATWATYQDALPAILDRLRGVYLSCEDAIACIRRWDSPHTLVYCDPPYPGTDQGHYKGYTHDDWQALCACLDAAQCSYVLSNYPQTVEPESTQQRIEIQAVMSAAKGMNGEARTEVLWTCDRSTNARGDIARLMRGEQREMEL